MVYLEMQSENDPWCIVCQASALFFFFTRQPLDGADMLSEGSEAG